jgi:hypothetical protein
VRRGCERVCLRECEQVVKEVRLALHLRTPRADAAPSARARSGFDPGAVVYPHETGKRLPRLRERGALYRFR